MGLKCSNPTEFIPKAEADARRRSIAQLMRVVIGISDPEILDEQKLQVLDTLLWKYTEADGKHNTPFRSTGVLENPDAEVQPEHVFTRSHLKHLLLTSRPEDVDRILQDAVGCLVTVEEHDKLSVHDGKAIGWQRYDLAEVNWTDLRTEVAHTKDLPLP